ncbi:hypothetical protein [Oligoflexus tunisiensis]|uniref:hypothetical protein n=1 Tax=Oligoflexus tunisiensis TaxID=708132 RepID=UPI00114D0C6A|nr:hypothetical protein [Oligoflexus tunisiensis]
MSYDSKRLRFVLVTMASGLFPSTPSWAEPTDHDNTVCEKLAGVIHDPQIHVRLESRPDGFILRMDSQQANSQTAARAFAVEVLKQHNLAVEVPHTNGYGLPEQ